MPDLEDAIALALKAHRGKTDKANRPYILHPVRVMLKQEDDLSRIVAILHDVVEDSEYDLESLRQMGYPEEIITALDCVTRRDTEDYEAFVARAKSNPIACKVKLADLEDNMDIRRLEAIDDWGAERLRKYLKAWRLLTTTEDSQVCGEEGLGQEDGAFRRLPGLMDGEEGTLAERPGRNPEDSDSAGGANLAPERWQGRSPASAEEAWRDFQRNLASTLGDLEEDDFLILSHKRNDAFVQFAGQGAFGMRAEARPLVGDEGDLAEEIRQTLLALGWQPPTYTLGEEQPEPAEGSPNYFIDVDPPVPCDRLARLAVVTLRAALGARHPGELTYWAFSDPGTCIRFPLLKIKRAALR